MANGQAVGKPHRQTLNAENRGARKANMAEQSLSELEVMVGRQSSAFHVDIEPGGVAD